MLLSNQNVPSYKNDKLAHPCQPKGQMIVIYRLMFLLTMILSSVVEKMKNEVQNWIEENNQAYISELEKELSTRCVCFQYARDNDETTKDLVMSFMDFWKEKCNKKLSACFVNKSVLDMSKDENMNLVLDFILKQGKIGKNIFLKDTLIIDDLSSVSDAAVLDKIFEKLKGFDFNFVMFIYDVECIPNGEFVFDYLFKSRHRFDVIKKSLYFYIALKSTNMIEESVKQFKEYLKGRPYDHLKALEGQLVHLNLPNERFPHYSLIQDGFRKCDWFNDRWSNTGYLKGYLKFLQNFDPVNMNENQNFQIAFGFNCFTMNIYCYDTNHSYVTRFNDITENKYNGKYIIKIITNSHDRRIWEGYSNEYNIIFPDGIVVSKKLGIQRIIIYENFDIKNLYEYYYCFDPQEGGIIKVQDKKYAKYHEKFTYLLSLWKINVEKCLKYRYYKKIHYFMETRFWLENELYLSQGKTFKYISTVDIKTTDDLRQKILNLKSDLESKLRKENAKIDLIQFWPKNKFDDLNSFYKNITDSFGNYCTDLAISDELKKLNENMPELGLRITTGGTSYTNNYYLFIVPSFIFEFWIISNQTKNSFSERIVKNIDLLSYTLPPNVIRYYTSFVNHPQFLKTFDRHLLKCLFTKEPEARKNIIKEAVLESIIKIIPYLKEENTFSLVIGSLQYLNFIETLVPIILSVLDTVVKEMNQNVKNIECIIVLEGEFDYLIEEYNAIQELIHKHFKTISD